MLSFRRSSALQKVIAKLTARRLSLSSGNNGMAIVGSAVLNELHSMQIEKLKKDNETLQEEMGLASRSVASLENAQVAQQLARLAEQKDVYERKVQQEQIRQKELDDQVKALQQKIHEERTRMGGVNAAKDHTHQVAKQVKILENRLEKVRSLLCLPSVLFPHTSLGDGEVQRLVDTQPRASRTDR